VGGMEEVGAGWSYSEPPLLDEVREWDMCMPLLSGSRCDRQSARTASTPRAGNAS